MAIVLLCWWGATGSDASGGAARSAERLVIDHGPVFEDHGSASGDVIPFFKLFPKQYRWKSHTVTYFNTAREYDKQVKQAAAAWNSSGARIHWKRASRRTAKVRIKLDPSIKGSILGYADLSDGKHATIRLRPKTTRRFKPKPYGKAVARVVVTHEMGHVMGLNHEPRACATMDAGVYVNCRFSKEPWQYQCRALQPDDLKGAVKLFGGQPKQKSIGPEFCPLEAAPSPLAGFTASYDGTRSRTQHTSSLPAKHKPDNVEIIRGKKDGSCPKADGSGSSSRFSAKASSGGTFDYPEAQGSYCYLAVPQGKLGRPGKAASAKVQVTGSAADADFDYYQLAGTSVEFYDYSYDPDGHVVARRWTFGDGSAASTQAEPTHDFPAPGKYQVTLRVTDNDGNTSQRTRTVTVEPDEAPFADFEWDRNARQVYFYDYSYDDDGEVVDWDWTFGDGSANSTERDPTHRYSAAGSYTVTLSIRDDGGNTAETSRTVTVP